MKNAFARLKKVGWLLDMANVVTIKVDVPTVHVTLSTAPVYYVLLVWPPTWLRVNNLAMDRDSLVVLFPVVVSPTIMRLIHILSCISPVRYP